MDYSQFLEILLTQGRAVVPEIGSISPESRRDAKEVLAKYERIWRENLPRPLATFNQEAASWAAENVFRACQFSVYRDADKSVMRAALQEACPVKVTSDVHYSVDFTFRFLPDIEKSVRVASAKDPLLDILREWAMAWPLSSVGIPDLDAISIDGFASHPGLMQLYVDRVLTARDKSRSTNPMIQQQILASVGVHRSLATGFDLGEIQQDSGVSE